MQSPLPPRTSSSLGTGSLLAPSPTITANSKAPKKKRRSRNQFAEEERDNPSKKQLAGLFSPPQIRRHVTIPQDRSLSAQANKYIPLYDPNDPSGDPEYLEDPGDHPFDLQSNGFSLNATRSAHENFQNVIDRKPVPLAAAPSPSRLSRNFEMKSAHKDGAQTMTQQSPCHQQFTPERIHESEASKGSIYPFGFNSLVEGRLFSIRSDGERRNRKMIKVKKHLAFYNINKCTGNSGVGFMRGRASKPYWRGRYKCTFLSNATIIVGTPEDCYTEETAGIAKELHHQETVSNFIADESLKGCYCTCFKDYVKVDENLLNEYRRTVSGCLVEEFGRLTDAADVQVTTEDYWQLDKAANQVGIANVLARILYFFEQDMPSTLVPETGVDYVEYECNLQLLRRQFRLWKLGSSAKQEDQLYDYSSYGVKKGGTRLKSGAVYVFTRKAYKRVVGGKMRYFSAAPYAGQTQQKKDILRHNDSLAHHAQCTFFVDALRVFSPEMWEYKLVYRPPDGEERADFLLRAQEENFMLTGKVLKKLNICVEF